MQRQGAETVSKRLLNFFVDLFFRFGGLSFSQRLLLFQLLFEFFDALLEGLDLFENRCRIGQCAAAAQRENQHRYQKYDTDFHTFLLVSRNKKATGRASP
jgi:hypothetical protein